MYYTQPSPLARSIYPILQLRLLYTHLWRCLPSTQLPSPEDFYTLTRTRIEKSPRVILPLLLSFFQSVFSFMQFICYFGPTFFPRLLFVLVLFLKQWRHIPLILQTAGPHLLPVCVYFSSYAISQRGKNSSSNPANRSFDRSINQSVNQPMEPEQASETDRYIGGYGWR
ncbi:hypothetical protein N656DRAFT_566460 [Canariomyces notabilis]|uniref:Uncharacterized protein n=1 Tax=Canariomyces notabilis TaxID=2074819 RepID=A0AAN6TGK1_9PEZI|nr:hypothetical protein N656DRAFT_566460 [Canariomyces arenarius]